jgi:hypothetical protein
MVSQYNCFDFAVLTKVRPDTMMFVNVVVAITCLALCWTIFIVGFKGWMKVQAGLRIASHSNA